MPFLNVRGPQRVNAMRRGDDARATLGGVDAVASVKAVVCACAEVCELPRDVVEPGG